MFILIKRYGNHSNRLFQAIHLEAYCLEKSERFINLDFSDMASYYFDNYFKRLNHKILIRLILKFCKKNIIELVIDSQNENKMNISNFKAHLIKLVTGWGFFSHELTEKYRDYFISKYKLKDKFYKKNELYLWILSNKTKYVIVGLHIRRGDYQFFNEGKYYYSDSEYMLVVNCVEEIIKNTGSQCFFIVFSDSDVTFNSENIIVSKNEWYIDHVLMSNCSYLLGPPSTFTSWASYIGRVPLYHISNVQTKFDLSDFIVING